MVDLYLVMVDGGTYAFINGERVACEEIAHINEFYQIETREGCVANFRVPFDSVHVINGVLKVDEPEHDKRMNKSIRKLLGM